ncbi:transposase [Cyanobacterium sp. IPPAS B-1200]|uniref:transposase n=1 Tax=Cyanobacterium sp. IPPAS B-1200 TaxID=1562720 RepID=UPI003D4477CC
MFYQLKNGCNWSDLPKDLPPYSTVYWHYKNWKKEGVFETVMCELHKQLREKVKKIHLDSINYRRFSSSEKYL